MATIRPANEDDVERLLALASQAFNIASSSHDRIRQQMKLETYRVAEVDGRVQASARYIPFGHFYGGRAVRAAGVASVAVAAEARGKGLGTLVMNHLLGELRTDGYAISSLYPATAPIYKYAGYGYGAVRTEWKVSLRALPTSSSLAVEEFGDDQLDEVNDAYEQIAATANGLVQRPRDWWKNRVFLSWEGQPMYRYLVRENGRVAGWMIYRLAETKDHWRSTVACRDLFWSSAEAARALMSLAALHRSTCEYMTWVGPVSEPLEDLLPEDVFNSEDNFRTMLRLLDVPAAFEARGYHPQVRAALTIRVEDPLFEQNHGTWRVELDGGQAKCLPSDATSIDASADVKTWAQLWARMTTARDAVRTGGLRASDQALDTIDLLFAGPTPWIADFY